MTGFCVEKIQCDPQLRGEHGVLRVAAIAVTADARQAAARIMRQAQDEADALLRRAHEEASEVVREAEQQTLARASALLQSLEEANTSLVKRSQDIVISLAQGVFDRLVSDTTPRERVEAVLKRVLQEAQPGLSHPLLRLHPEDVELAPAVEWEIKPDASLPRGTCRLEASTGEWGADFCAAVTSLKTALMRTTSNTGMDDGESDASIVQHKN
ncbi:MAG TPA: HrpE/YscL family type III secretion apparatus protein [Noviherbaspirillum sp.]|nr:HrpE/YscL family type III secretion apparatus protein [Noviherbaspirillum sp.]